MMQNTKILLVEDDVNLGFVVKDNLENAGFIVTHASDGLEGSELFLNNKYDLCILDIMLPKKDGFTVAKGIREKDKHTPILFLTSRSIKEDKLNGFKVGADDYITKPFSIEELIMRIKVFLKRSGNWQEAPIRFTLGSYRFDFKNLTLSHPDENRKLTHKEACILRTLCAQMNQTIRREDILQSVWGDDDYFLGRSMDVFISKLRGYLKYDNKVQIETIHGIGFSLNTSE